MAICICITRSSLTILSASGLASFNKSLEITVFTDNFLLVNLSFANFAPLALGPLVSPTYAAVVPDIILRIVMFPLGIGTFLTPILSKIVLLYRDRKSVV